MCCAEFDYLPVNLITATVIVGLQYSLHFGIHVIVAIETDLAQVVDNTTRNHWYPKIIFLIYHVVCCKRQTKPR